MKRVILACTILASITFAPALQAQPRQADNPEFVTTPMRVVETKPTSFIYVEIETTYATMAEPVGKALAEFGAMIEAGKFIPRGPAMMVYQGATGDPNQPFTLQIGFPVNDDVKPNGNMKVRKIETTRVATLIFSGQIRHIGQAYQKLFQELFGQGLLPSGEHSELYLRWESAESDNNIVLLQIHLQ
jgi:effector-binding domain-containing protein